MRVLTPQQSSEQGGALLIALVSTVFLTGMAGALLAVGASRKAEQTASTERLRALYVAEAGLSRGVAAALAGTLPDLGSAEAPVGFSGGQYWGTAVDNGDDTVTLTVFGTSNGRTRGLEAVVQQTSDGVYSSALFAGNSSGDNAYELLFGGTGSQADLVNGNVYSGGSIRVNGTATINGTARATGSIHGGGGGETGITQPIPNLTAMNYAVNNGVNVAQQFATGGASYVTNSSYGGRAWRLPESNPAHIFRKNPSDRASNINSTAKDDYFLEDAYEPINTSSAINAGAGSKITISGLGGEPGPNGNNLVYYIDGNLWVHNLNAYSFTLWNASGTPVNITLVVSGNIYISDNIFYNNNDADGLALIAMKDPNVADSGNIYFGDPSFGTLEYMSAFMYAENNFYDNNLSASGSARVTVRGNMTAGNQVRINRDHGNQHSKLTVDFDPRIWNQSLTLPGLPSMSGSDPTRVVASWREVPVL
ncbi:MAG: hypothetical protein JNK02_10600 [Planctomycetes bacterium]|nr:hypothetical protein [Planctomycetota bacterium]